MVQTVVEQTGGIRFVDWCVPKWSEPKDRGKIERRRKEEGFKMGGCRGCRDTCG
jgi:hypothetical protein